MSTKVRRAVLRDLGALTNLELHFDGDRLSRRSFRHLLFRAHAEVWVYETEGRVCGNAVVLYRRGTHCARTYSLVVDSLYQGRGIATALMHAIELAAARHGCRRLHLEVRPDNAAALRLYRKLGYVVVARLPDYYQDHGPALRLQKSLSLPSPGEAEFSHRHLTCLRAAERSHTEGRAGVNRSRAAAPWKACKQVKSAP